MKINLEKISLTILLLASMLWLGGSVIRAVIGFDLLQFGTLDFKPNIHPYVERTVYAQIAQSTLVVDIAYIVVWIAGILYLKSTRLRLKDEGWLVMIAIFFYMFTPMEIYLMVLDTKIWLLDHIGSNDLVEFRILFIHRLAALSGVPLIATLCYYMGAVLAVFRPLRRSIPAGSIPTN